MSLRKALHVLADTAPVVVYDGKVLQPPAPRYGVLYASAGLLTAEDVANTPNLLDEYFQITSVGRGPEEVEYVAELVRDALVGNRPTDTAWETGPVVHTSSGPIRRDDDRPDVAVFYAVDNYHVMAARS